MISDKLYQLLDTKNALPDEQKGCRKGSQGTSDKLYIDKMALREAKWRENNLATVWIEYKKAYERILHPWILECLELSSAAQNIKTLLENSMIGWETELTANG